MRYAISPKAKLVFLWSSFFCGAHAIVLAQDTIPINPFSPVSIADDTRILGDDPSEPASVTETIGETVWKQEQILNHTQFYETGSENVDLDVLATESMRLEEARKVQDPKNPAPISPRLNIHGLPVFDLQEGAVPTTQDSTVWVQQYNQWIADRVYQRDPAVLGADMKYRNVLRPYEYQVGDDEVLAGFRPTEERQVVLDARPRLEETVISEDENKEFLARQLESPVPNRKYAGRLEIRDLSVVDPIELQIYQASRGVFGIIMANRLLETGNGKWQVDTSLKVGVSYGLCEDQAYWSQPSACYCTAFLVAPGIVATAAHCLEGVQLSDIRLIAGFELASKSGIVDYAIAADDIYEPVELMNDAAGQNLDFVFLRLKENAAFQKILPLATAAAHPADSVYAIGFPSGLPMKVAGIGPVTQTEGGVYFYSDIDTYEGNSGSPVFNARTHEVVGILIEGEQDFERQGNCSRAKPCFGSNCKGEKAISATQMIPYLVLTSRN